MSELPPENPAGPFVSVAVFQSDVKDRLVDVVRVAPAKLREAVAGLSEQQLDTPYRNWTIRQIVHHLADSHLHSIIRFKWALTEQHPTIKAYHEGDWAELQDSRIGDIQPALGLLDGLHAKWVQLLESMTDEQYGRTFHHPESGESVSLWKALNLYAWHGQHHTAQIRWRREQNGW